MMRNKTHKASSVNIEVAMRERLDMKRKMGGSVLGQVISYLLASSNLVSVAKRHWTRLVFKLQYFHLALPNICIK